MFIISEEARQRVEEMIDEGWHFSLEWGDLLTSKGGKKRWEADFTRRLHDGEGNWDNHEYGYSWDDPSAAIVQSYNNVRAGRKLKP